MKKKYLKQKELRKQRRQEGKCVQCGKLPLYSKTMCQKCFEAHKLVNKRNYERKKSLGLCLSCGKNPAAPNHQYCISCLEKHQHRNPVYAWEGRIMLLKAMGGRCALCGTEELRVLEIDHKQLYHHRRNGLDWNAVGRAARISGTVRNAILVHWRKGELRLLCRNCNKIEALKQIGSEEYFEEALENINKGKVIRTKWEENKRPSRLVSTALLVLDKTKSTNDGIG